ncbi:hypothetical protein DFH11DRAFT_149579 [Phellopilus nigrolimitatus]|nr:hypothetical protein DFH11DRAFT_149579 [Phellopilus nigrolimitatus]
MTSAIVLPPLKTWAQQRLTTLITAKTQADFNQAFDNFISKNVQVTFNGAPLTRDQYKQQFQGERFLESNATIKVLNAVQAPQLNTQVTQDSGLVGIFYDATFVEKILVLGAPAEHSTQSSLNIQVAQDELIPLPPAGIRGDVDRRRVVALNQVSVDQRGEIQNN